VTDKIKKGKEKVAFILIQDMLGDFLSSCCRAHCLNGYEKEYSTCPAVQVPLGT